jgi:hypothetical protein
MAANLRGVPVPLCARGGARRTPWWSATIRWHKDFCLKQKRRQRRLAIISWTVGPTQSRMVGHHYESKWQANGGLFPVIRSTISLRRMVALMSAHRGT